MYSSKERLKKRTGKNKVDRPEFLKLLVQEYRTTKSSEAKRQVLANLANFAYDPINYEWLRNLDVVQLFLEELASADEKIVEFAIGGLCNLCLAGSLSRRWACPGGVSDWLTAARSQRGRRRCGSLRCGSSVSVERLVTRDDVESFAKLSGDFNPIHFTDKKPIVHGALLNSFLSGVIGTKLPGPGTILSSQNFRYPNPCYAEDIIVIQVSVERLRKITTCEYRISRKSDDATLMEGSAKVIIRMPSG
ncbi:unnamed protein product [Nesidiocoris tenuis]|uniref:MaoC-like domain-containing protein n=1 Tax=Nesidiocoris tenuis TaxID=355587 RepID=A0A6H5GZM8_9HEMI|nr:unnamed protein product [Nesidiocoris tenuis]